MNPPSPTVQKPLASCNLTVANETYILLRPDDDYSKRLGSANPDSLSASWTRSGGVTVQYITRRKVKIKKRGWVGVKLSRIEQAAEELAEDMVGGRDKLGNSDDDVAEEVEAEHE